jgi:FkbM family methyltransferase
MDKLIDFNVIPKNITHIKLDIGLGMNNVQSQNWLKYEKNLFVFMFEPNVDSKNSSISNMHNIKNIIDINNNAFTIIPVALSNVEKESFMDFYSMLNDGGTSSLYKPTNLDRLGPIKSKINVRVFSLKHFFELFPWDKFEYIEYIKIDTQGADFDIIQSAGDYLSERVVFITAEPEINYYENCSHNTSKNMENYLISKNFIRINHPNTDDPTFINKKFMHLHDSIYIYQK